MKYANCRTRKSISALRQKKGKDKNFSSYNRFHNFGLLFYLCRMNFLKNIQQKLREAVQISMPNTIKETFVLVFFLLGYGILAWYIAENYTVVFDNRVPWDAYFSFDNRAIVFTGGGFERHPLANYFFDGIREIASWYSGGIMDKNFRVALALMCSTAVSFSMLYIFKYLKNIIQLPDFLAFPLVVFTGCFSTSILLSFTPETYTYTLFLLCIFNYFVAKKSQNQEKLSSFALTIFGVSVGGLTITNIVKVYIPILFEKGVFRSYKMFFNAVLRVGISCTIFVLLYLSRLNFDITKILNKTSEQYERFSQPKAVPLWDMMYSWFFGGNVVFSSYMVRNYKSPKGFEYKALFMDTFDSWGQYVFVGILMLLVVWSVIKNFKNPLVKILALSFLVDILIHCVLKFGLHTSYIYGGHFIFVYPLLLGWLFHAYRANKVIFPALILIFGGLMGFFLINNFIRMDEFFHFIEQHHKG